MNRQRDRQDGIRPADTRTSVPAIIDPYDAHLQLSQAEFDGMFLALIHAMATTYSPTDSNGPYTHLLDALAKVACHSKCHVDEAGRRYFRERVEATVARGFADQSQPPVHRDGDVLIFDQYRPFRKKRADINDNRSAQWNAKWVRSWNTFTGRAKIVEDKTATYYCEILDIDDRDDVEWPCWDRTIRVPKNDVMEACETIRESWEIRSQATRGSRTV